MESAIELATTNFNSALATEIADRQSADATEANARAAADAAEASARTEAITVITNSKSHTVGIETKPDGSKAVKQNEVATMGVGNTEDPLVLKSYIDFLEARLADVEEKLIPRFKKDKNEKYYR